MALALVAACSRAEPPVLVPDPAPRAAVADAGVAPAAVVTLSPEARAAMDGALARYEVLRKKLAGDTVEGVAADAAALADLVAKATSALGPAPDEAVARPLAALGAAVKGWAPGDLEAARAWFGGVSKALIALGGAVPALREGRRVFSCPMTDHYPKWVQIDATVDNPLQGSKMLTCGEASDWRE